MWGGKPSLLLFTLKFLLTQGLTPHSGRMDRILLYLTFSIIYNLVSVCLTLIRYSELLPNSRLDSKAYENYFI